MKACLIIPYYGKWPIFLPFFLESCRINSWLDVIFFTDIQNIPNHPENVKFIHFTTHQIQERVSRLTGLNNYRLPFTYKLCDLKPMYGDIFEKYVSTYEYWAFGDCDILFGEVINFIEEELKIKTDFISFHEKYLSGSFTLIKNNLNNNKLYLKLENLQKNLQTNAFEGIDEVCHQWDAKKRIDLSPACLTYWVEKGTMEGTLTSSFRSRIVEEIKAKDIIKYNENILTYNDKKIAYFHYVRNKNQSIFKFPKWNRSPKMFYINETGFYTSEKQANILRPIKKYPRLLFYYLKKLPIYLFCKLSYKS